MNIQKCRVTRVGSIENGKPVGFHFDGEFKLDTFGHIVNSRGEALYGGWTVDELTEMIRQNGGPERLQSPLWFAIGATFTTPLASVLMACTAVALLVAWPIIPFLCYFQRKDELLRKKLATGHMLGDWP
jgi:hypothetical protein